MCDLLFKVEKRAVELASTVGGVAGLVAGPAGATMGASVAGGIVKGCIALKKALS